MWFLKAAHPLTESAQLLLPLFSMPVSAGSPAPADGDIEERLDLARLLVKRPASTFYVRVEGESMIEAAIYPGDILVVDRSVEARHNDVVIALVDGEFTVKSLHQQPALRLISQNPAHQTEITEPFEIWGVVLWVIHKAR